MIRILIILQLKSATRIPDLDDISSIIKTIRDKHDYRMIGHEIQQLDSILKNTSLQERVRTVTDFCAKNEIEYLTYHTPIFENGENIWDPKWRDLVRDSISITAEEAEEVYKKAGLKEQVIVNFHLTNYLPLEKLPITREQKFHFMEKAETEFLDLYQSKLSKSSDGIIIFALENSYPKYYQNFAITSPCHPSEITRLEKYGIKTTLDVAHFQLYSNMLAFPGANQVANCDREIYNDRHRRSHAPSWKEAIDILRESLVLVHLSDASGTSSENEGLGFGRGQIKFEDIFEQVMTIDKAAIRATIEVKDGHMNGAIDQLENASWLLSRYRNYLFAD